jgi:hypothetical protein
MRVARSTKIINSLFETNLKYVLSNVIRNRLEYNICFNALVNINTSDYARYIFDNFSHELFLRSNKILDEYTFMNNYSKYEEILVEYLTNTLNMLRRDITSRSKHLFRQLKIRECNYKRAFLMSVDDEVKILIEDNRDVILKKHLINVFYIYIRSFA